jgi:hypothetical protein
MTVRFWLDKYPLFRRIVSLLHDIRRSFITVLLPSNNTRIPRQQRFQYTSARTASRHLAFSKLLTNTSTGYSSSRLWARQLRPVARQSLVSLTNTSIRATIATGGFVVTSLLTSISTRQLTSSSAIIVTGGSVVSRFLDQHFNSRAHGFKLRSALQRLANSSYPNLWISYECDVGASVKPDNCTALQGPVISN